MRFVVLILAMLVAGSTLAQSWVEPARGAPTRKALMDVLRPHAMWALSGAVEFVIHNLRLSGPLAFSSVASQRSGNGTIDPTRTPVYQRGELDLEFMDGLAIQALYFKPGNTWVAVHWEMGTTDAWYACEPLCAVWHMVIAESCQSL